MKVTEIETMCGSRKRECDDVGEIIETTRNEDKVLKRERQERGISQEGGLTTYREKKRRKSRNEFTMKESLQKRLVREISTLEI